MNDNVGRYIVVNNEIKAPEFSKTVEDSGSKLVYEVIRIIDGVPLFFEEHCERMHNSLAAIGVTNTPSEVDLRLAMGSLLKVNDTKNCNVKVISSKEGDKASTLIYISRSYYPPRSEVEAGVSAGLVHIERETPNVKLINNNYKKAVAEAIQNKGVFEVLLVNSNEKITEGSKSNAFFIKGSKVFTAPGEYILKGITRSHIIETCRKAGFEVIEALIPLKELKGIDGLFISGTSIKVLPVSKVDTMEFKSASNAVIVAVRDAFDMFIDDYVKSNPTVFA